MTRSNKEVVMAYVDAFNRGDIDGLCSLFAPGAQIWGVLGFGSLESARPIWSDLMECLRMQLKVEAIVSEGNTVAVRYTESGTSVKPFRGAPATGRSYELIAMEWFEMKDGLIHRRWGARDSANMARQLGFPQLM
jgi:predicted ester cyclase